MIFTPIIMRLAIFLCLPIIVYIALLITADSLKPVYDFPTNTTFPKIPPHVAPLVGFVSTLSIALVMALQTHETPEIFLGMLIQAGVYLNLSVFPPGTSSEFKSFDHVVNTANLRC